MENSTNYAATTTQLEKAHLPSRHQTQGKALKVILEAMDSFHLSTSPRSTSTAKGGKPSEAILKRIRSRHFSTSSSPKSRVNRGKPPKAYLKLDDSGCLSTSASSTSTINRGTPPKAYLRFNDAAHSSTSPSPKSSSNPSPSSSDPSAPSTTTLKIIFKPRFIPENFVNPWPTKHQTREFSEQLITQLSLPDEDYAAQIQSSYFSLPHLKEYCGKQIQSSGQQVTNANRAFNVYKSVEDLNTGNPDVLSLTEELLNANGKIKRKFKEVVGHFVETEGLLILQYVLVEKVYRGQGAGRLMFDTLLAFA